MRRQVLGAVLAQYREDDEARRSAPAPEEPRTVADVVPVPAAALEQPPARRDHSLR
jgi:hypothetical protein